MLKHDVRYPHLGIGNNLFEHFVTQGGYVENHRGTWRVHGTLAVSRSIGDAHLKEWVLAEPDTKVVDLTPDMQYLVLASDGLWDEVN